MLTGRIKSLALLFLVKQELLQFPEVRSPEFAPKSVFPSWLQAWINFIFDNILCFCLHHEAKIRVLQPTARAEKRNNVLWEKQEDSFPSWREKPYLNGIRAALLINRYLHLF